MNYLRYFCLFIFIYVSALSLSYAEGIHFEKGTWAEAVSKAKQENKLLYVDFYTTWCGPCKLMAKKYFENDTAGAYYNKHFVAYKVDAEKGEGIELAKKYNIKGYPTNLFIDPRTEKVVYKTTGCPMELSGFLKNGNIAIEEKNDPMTIEDYDKKWNNKKYDKKFLENYLQKNTRLDRNNDTVFDVYINKFAGKMPADTLLQWIDAYGVTALSPQFPKIVSAKDNIKNQHKQDVINSMVYGAVEQAKKERDERKMIIAAEWMKTYYDNGALYVFSELHDFYKTPRNSEKIKALYMEYGNYYASISDAELKKGNDEFNKSILMSVQEQIKITFPNLTADELDKETQRQIDARPEIQNTYSKRVADNLNEICWETFLHFAADKNLLQNAAQWSKRSMQLTQNDPSSWCAFGDTYAHILYSLGDKKQALEIQSQVVAKAEETKLEDFDDAKAFLEKLQKEIK